MSVPKTLKELMESGNLTRGEVRKLARLVFDGKTKLSQSHVPYGVTLPVFDDLPEHVQGFIVKAILNSKLSTLWDHENPGYPTDRNGGVDFG